MTKLDEVRLLIDDIDSKIIELYEKRMDVIMEVTKYKMENNLPVLDSSREASMLNKNINKIINENYKQYYYHVLDGFLKASKDMQKELLKKD